MENKDIETKTSGNTIKGNTDKRTIREIINSDLDKSEVIETLSKRVIVSEIHMPDYNYFLTKIFGKKMVFDGLLDIDYIEYIVDNTGDAHSAVVIDDFNARSNKVIRETIVANKQANVKTKILDSAIMNFRTNPADAIKVAFTNAANIAKSQELTWEQEMWKKIKSVPEAYIVDTTSFKGDIEINKKIYNTILSIGTTSKSHVYIGNKGTITVDNGDSIKPALKFDSKDMILISDSDFETNTIFDGERSFFNWSGSSLELASTHVIDFSVYEPLVEGEWEGIKAILIHKEIFVNIVDWEISKLFNGPKAFHIVANYIKILAHMRKNFPIIVFKSIPVIPDSGKNKNKGKDKDKK